MRLAIKVKQSLLLVALSMLAFGISDVQAGDIDAYVLTERFTWREFDAGGQLLKESGARYGLGVAFRHEFTNHLTVQPRIEFNGGYVDYAGRTPSDKPVETATKYFGVKLEMDIGVRIRQSQSFVLEPVAGIGMREWDRRINEGTTANGTHVPGKTETWSTSYGRLGLRGDQSWGQANNIFMLAGVKLPIQTKTSNDDTGRQSLKPGNKPSLFAEAGVMLDGGKNRGKISAFYDGMRFKQSPTVVIGGSEFYQPKSESDMLGIKFSVLF